MDMETTQIAGVDDTLRKTGGTLAAGSTLTVHEKIMTTGDQHAITDFAIDLNGENCSTDVVSRSVARDHSKQEFRSSINGNNACAGHSECDAIIMDKACVIATPALTANHVDAALIHEAAIGKIAGEPDHQTDDPRPDRRGSRAGDRQRIPKINEGGSSHEYYRTLLKICGLRHQQR